jgi:hypothetical protein
VGWGGLFLSQCLAFAGCACVCLCRGHSDTTVGGGKSNLASDTYVDP